MKIAPTLEGGLRIDAEESTDWLLLLGIASDASACDEGLADRLGNLVTDGEVAHDWREYVVPDLDEQFSSALLHVTTEVTNARLEASDGPGSLWITRENGYQWFSALNQARLALEEECRFGPSDSLDLATLPPDRRSAFLRSQFYCAIQSLLLEHVMK